MARKSESELPVLPSEKPPLPPLPPDHPQCAAESACRKPGFFSPVEYHIKGANERDRFCRDHLYARIDAQAAEEKLRRKVVGA